MHPMAKDVIALSSYSWSHSVLRFSGFAAFTASSKFIRNTARERERKESEVRRENESKEEDLPEEEEEEETYFRMSQTTSPVW